ncbi:hypothetical protein EW145_g15 [Phellinidium pouzarii]|uniref:Uncharacterized protein n=1 Tax=Phellinidium pouzarii TaxID=167371 RepID=A0A4S4LJW0_9AGAM|nr:hypothetical protein EW145_g15 [Phellinidium pouzarii]
MNSADDVTERVAVGELLAADHNVSPRPLPPARLRRATSSTLFSTSAPINALDYRSPPPYAPGAATNPLPVLTSPETDYPKWMHLKTQEELEDLLKRADSIIKEREHELDITSHTVRSLAESNAALKSKNNALIARLPPSQPSSPLSSPISTFSPSHSRSSSRAFLWSPKLPPGHRRTHSRHVSNTPAELAALADQNAELLDKLHDLEADAERADQAAKRRLKGLENELQTIKDELEKTRTMGERLEETLQSTSKLTGLPDGLDEQLIKSWKKLRREAKVRELKAKTRPWDQSDAADEPKDFAPGSVSFSSQSDHKPFKLSLSSPTDDHLFFEIESPLPIHSNLVPNLREQALVSQLLLKVNELEETNAQLAVQHLEARLKLRHAEYETENVKRLCDFIGDEVRAGIEFEMVVDGAAADGSEVLDAMPDLLEASPRKTFRLRSIGRKASLDFDAVRRQQDSAGGLRRSSSMESLASTRAQRMHEKADLIKRSPRNAQKARKSVLGLFEEGPSTSSKSQLGSGQRHGQYSQGSLPALSVLEDHSGPDVPSDDSQSLGDLSAYGNASFDTNDSLGDADNARMPSLGSELGLEMGLGLGLGVHSPAPMHVRSRSIADLLNAVEGDEKLVSPSVEGLRPSLSVVSSSLCYAGVEAKAEPEALPLDDRITYPTLRRTQMRSPAHVKKDNETETVERPTWSLNPASDLFPGIQSPSRFRSSTLDADASSESGDFVMRQKPKNKFANLLIELWLWLQFVVVIIVFVCTMARMGPKSLFRASTAAQKAYAQFIILSPASAFAILPLL